MPGLTRTRPSQVTRDRLVAIAALSITLLASQAPAIASHTDEWPSPGCAGVDDYTLDGGAIVVASGLEWHEGETLVGAITGPVGQSAFTAVFEEGGPEVVLASGEQTLVYTFTETYHSLYKLTIYVDGRSQDVSMYVSCSSEPPDTDGDGIVDADDVCPDTLLPDEASDDLKPHRYETNSDGQFVDRDGNVWANLTSTSGCSLSQIIEEAGLGAGHTRFGISRSALDGWITSQGGPPR